jgi:hypothetical protein
MGSEGHRQERVGLAIAATEMKQVADTCQVVILMAACIGQAQALRSLK